MAIGLLMAQQDQRLKILPPSFGLVVRGDGTEKDDMK